MFKKIAAILAVFCMAFMFAACSSAGSESEESNAASTQETEEVSEGSVEGGQKYLAEINVKDYGTITVELDEGIAPETVKNFVKLASEGFYDGLTFHRIIEGFMIQGGDPNGNGTGGSDETIKGEFLANGFNNTLSHTRGVISMARSSSYDSASSQFFIMQEDGTYLDGQYAAFGEVVDGMDIVDAIAQQAEPTDNNGTIEADEQPVIESITITEE
jgi:peptidyl-prolyl cis-trans isomerase B (cyclophilin B)